MDINLEPTVLSLSFDAEKLKLREDILREAGFQVVTAYSPGQARFEIESNRCKIFITSSLVPDIVNRDLVNLFRRINPMGLVILVYGSHAALIAAHEPEVDVRVPESSGPDALLPIIRGHLKKSRTA